LDTVLNFNSVSYTQIDDASWEENQLAHERWCNDLAANFLCVFVLDRFGDFVSDQVFHPLCVYIEILMYFYLGSSAGPRNGITNARITAASHAS
jgi:hypothetical protein